MNNNTNSVAKSEVTKSGDNFAWFYKPAEPDYVVALCDGHAYLAAECKFQPGTGTLYGLREPTLCCVCIGTATHRKMIGKPKREPTALEQVAKEDPFELHGREASGDEAPHSEYQPGNPSREDWDLINVGRRAIDVAHCAVNLVACQMCMRTDEHGEKCVIVYAGETEIEAEAHGCRFAALKPGGELRGEHGGFWGNWLALAWEVLAAGRSAKWKTFGMLCTLRQAFRECWAQGMNLEMPKAGASEAAVRGFLIQARAHDRVHHGEETF